MFSTLLHMYTVCSSIYLFAKLFVSHVIVCICFQIFSCFWVKCLEQRFLWNVVN